MKHRISGKWFAWLVIASLVAFGVMLGTYLTTPLPPPSVSLDIVRFGRQGTNLYAVIVLTNQGSVPVWSQPLDWWVASETKDGWVTNYPEYFTTADYPLRPGSNRVFRVTVPPDAVRWRVVRFYRFLRKPSLRWDYVDWAMHRGNISKLDDWIAAILARTESPAYREGEVASPFVTNSLLPEFFQIEDIGEHPSLPPDQ